MKMISKSELEYRIALGQSLKKYREMMGLTLTDVSNHTGMNKGLISNIEHGKRPISINDLEKLADLYRTRSSFIHQGAADRLDILGLNDPRLFIELDIDLDGATLIVKSKRGNREKKYRIPESLLAEMHNDFDF